MTGFLSALLIVGVLGAVAILGFWVGRSRRRAREDERAESWRQDSEHAEDRAASAEALVNWLRMALDESTDGIVIVDRIGREVLRNSVARRFLDARDAELLAEDALMEMLQAARE